MAYYEYSRTEGLKDFMSGHVVADETSLMAALEQAKTTFKARQNANFIFSDVDGLDAETARRGTSPSWSGSRSRGRAR